MFDPQPSVGSRPARPSVLVLPTDQWTPDEYITVQLGEIFVPDEGRYLVLHRTEAGTLDEFFDLLKSAGSSELEL